jgi:hypothetical protein
LIFQCLITYYTHRLTFCPDLALSSTLAKVVFFSGLTGASLPVIALSTFEATVSGASVSSFSRTEMMT